MVGRLQETGILLELQVGERKEECPSRAAIGRTAALLIRDQPETDRNNVAGRESRRKGRHSHGYRLEA